MREDRDAAAAPSATTGELVVVLPVLRRPHRVRPLLASLEAATPEPHRTMFVGTAGDRPMIAEVEAAAVDFPNVTLEVLAPSTTGDYARKVNHAYRVTSEPFLFLGADDLDFRPGWWPAALRLFDDPQIGVVGTQDLAPTERARTGEHATHVAVRRRYVDELGTIDEPGKILHEGYPHEYVDDELVGTAKHRGAWAFAFDSVVEHLHPSWGKAPRDPLYARQRARMAAGQRLFLTRRRLWTASK